MLAIRRFIKSIAIMMIVLNLFIFTAQNVYALPPFIVPVIIGVVKLVLDRYSYTEFSEPCQTFNRMLIGNRYRTYVGWGEKTVCYRTATLDYCTPTNCKVDLWQLELETER